MKKFLLFAINLLLFSNLMLAQGKLDYDSDSKWFWGFNYGATWQTTDVDYKLYHGWGLTLGKSFNYNYGKVFSFDIRGRYLTGNWYGQNSDSTKLSSTYQGIYSQQGSNYKDSLGFTYLNFNSKINRLALELVIHANRVRETTGFDPYIFGGVGFTWYDSKANIINDNSFETNQIYNYDSLATYSVSSLTSLQDKSYETPISSYKPAFMPSLGFGLGYQVGKRVSIGVEHKTTFTQRDNFDGIEQSSKYKQDLYHYTSAYIRFQIRTRASRHENNHSNTSNTTNPPITDPTITQNSKQLPIVLFTNPASSGTTVNSANYVIRADVKYVDDRDHIVFKQENTSNTNFTFNAASDQFVSNVVLQIGFNTFEITGTNQYGSDIKSTIVIYKRDEGTPPIVTITNPSTNPTTVSNSVFNFTSNILNVDQTKQVELNFNGQNFTSFIFNPTTHNVTATLNLKPGSNTVVVKGTNNFGTDSKTTTIIFERPQVAQPPVVTITNPSINPFTVSSANYNLTSTILNVTTQNQIVVKFNGQPLTNFTFNPATHSIAVPLNLILGSNTLSVTGTNAVGSDSKSTVIIYQQAQQVIPPVVTFIDPSSSPLTVSNSTYNVIAKVLNVVDKQNIELKINGLISTNFTYVNSTKQVAFTTNLQLGANVFELKGVNAAGQDVASTTIIYRKIEEKLPPSVTITNPLENPYTTSIASQNIEATILNVESQSNIQVVVNGSSITNFTYNSTTKKVNFVANLVEGSNNIDIKGINSVGQASDNTIVIYRKEVVVPPPFVTFTNPISSGLIVKSAAYIMKAKVTNVTSISQIELKKDNQIINQSAYSFNSSTKEVIFNTNLTEGKNYFTVTGTNSAGTHTATTFVIYEIDTPPCSMPIISFINPSSISQEVNSNSFTIRAKIENVYQVSQIKVLLNGVEQVAGNYDPSIKMFTQNITLAENSNTVEIKTTNECGKVAEQRIVIFKPVIVPCIPPILTITRSSIPNFSTTKAETVTIQISSTNVTNQSQLGVFFNDNSIPFTFNLQQQTITINKQLIIGVNDFQIKATTNCGRTTVQYKVTHEEIIEVNPPVVTFIYPNKCPMKIPVGKNSITGTISNVTNASQVSIKVNNEAITSFNPVFSENGMKFEFTLIVVNTVPEYVITVQATNNAGTDSTSCKGFPSTTSTPSTGTIKNTSTPDNSKPAGTNTGVVSPTKPTTPVAPPAGKGGN